MKSVFLLHQMPSVITNFALSLLLLWVADGRTSAQVNLLPQGDFKQPGANTEWAEGFNIPGNQEFQVISENGKSWLRIENHDAGRQLDYVHAYVRITPEIKSLTVSARLKATNLKVGRVLEAGRLSWRGAAARNGTFTMGHESTGPGTNAR
jgi:hypothetical protein